MDSQPYSHETLIFTLGALHEEVQGRQTKLHPGQTSAAFPRYLNSWEIPTLFYPNGPYDVLQNFLINDIGQWTWCIFISGIFLQKFKKWHGSHKKNYQNYHQATGTASRVNNGSGRAQRATEP